MGWGGGGVEGAFGHILAMYLVKLVCDYVYLPFFAGVTTVRFEVLYFSVLQLCNNTVLEVQN